MPCRGSLERERSCVSRGKTDHLRGNVTAARSAEHHLAAVTRRRAASWKVLPVVETTEVADGDNRKIAGFGPRLPFGRRALLERERQHVALGDPDAHFAFEACGEVRLERGDRDPALARGIQVV